MLNKRIGSRGEMALFARNFLKHPRMLGWVLPSSRFLVDRLLRQIDWQRARVIVEYGPGVGTFTGEILRRMRPDATLLAIEINPEFAQYLRDSFCDSRLRVLEGSAEEVSRLLAQAKHAQADYIISGIPFKTLPEPLRDPIVRATRAALKPDGSFLVYQLSRKVLPYLERYFGQVTIDFEPFNFLPARLFYCSPKIFSEGVANGSPQTGEGIQKTPVASRNSA